MKILIKSLLFISLLVSSIGWSMTDADFKRFGQKLYDFKATGTWDDGFLKIRRFQGVKNIQVGFGIYNESKIGEKGSVVVSVGRTESSFKYYQLAEEFVTKGYSPVFVLEHRGQGTSERILKTSDAGTVEDFKDYVDDFHLFVTQVIPGILKQKNPKLSLLAHSMGGGIAGSYLTQYPSPFKSVVFSSPMFQVKLPTNESLALKTLKYTCDDGNWLYNGCDSYVPFGAPYNSYLTFEQNKTTSSREQFNLEMLQNELWPQINLGSATQRWLKTTILATQQLRLNAEKINTPFLIIHGQTDEYVENDGHKAVCSRNALCDIQQMDGSKHEPFWEEDTIRSKAVRLMFKHFDSF